MAIPTLMELTMSNTILLEKPENASSKVATLHKTMAMQPKQPTTEGGNFFVTNKNTHTDNIRIPIISARTFTTSYSYF